MPYGAYLASQPSWRVNSDLGWIVIVMALVGGLVSWFALQRQRWAWIALTVLSLNPIIWVINTIYARNRWAELVPETGDALTVMHSGQEPMTKGVLDRKLAGLSRPARMVLFACGLWVVAVIAFVFLFEPYGRYMNSDEVWHMIKVIIFPPAIVGIAYYGYRRIVVRPDF